MRLSTRHRAVLVCCGLMLAAASVACGDFTTVQSVIALVPGVDAQGNASLLLGANGPGKSYKNINTGIIIQINRALVPNLFPAPVAKPKHFHNLGLPILDPQTGETFTTTKDLLIVQGKRTPGVVTTALFIGNLYLVYDPRFPVLEESL